MSRFVTAALTVSAILLMSATGAFASCKNAVCVSGSDTSDGRLHNVYVSNQLSGATHYNVKVPHRDQFELHINHFSFDTKPGHTYTFSVQACKRGGVFSSSTCTKWATFTHTVAAQ
jgi:hypothetical protein